MALNAETVFALGSAIHSREGADQIAAAVAVTDTPGVVDSASGVLQLGTNTTDLITSKGLLLEQASNAITARAGGGQSLATALAAQYNRISVCATAADSVKLPPSAAGLEIVIVNDGAASAQVFGAGTDTINSVATATGVAQAAGTIVVYRCTASGNWRSAAATVVSGVSAGVKIASGIAAVTGTADVTTGLATVVTAQVSMITDPDGAALDAVSYVLGAAGHITVKAWKVTTGGAAGNPTLIAATVAANVAWLAIGT